MLVVTCGSPLAVSMRSASTPQSQAFGNSERTFQSDAGQQHGLLFAAVPCGQ